MHCKVILFPNILKQNDSLFVRFISKILNPMTMASRDDCSEIEIVNDGDWAAEGYGTSVTSG